MERPGRPGVAEGGARPRLLVVGTAHVIDLSAPLRKLLGARSLDGVAVELDRERADVLLGGRADHGSSNAPLLARLWGILQRRLGAEIGGGDAGEEMKIAAAYARERNLPLFLIDDPIRQTFSVLLRSLSAKERVTLLAGAVVGLFVPARVVKGEVERYTERPEQFAEEIRQVSPTVARVLLDDRNEHMAERLAEIVRHGFLRLAVVVGDAHLPGLSAALARRGIEVDAVPFRELRGPTASSSSSS